MVDAYLECGWGGSHNEAWSHEGADHDVSPSGRQRHRRISFNGRHPGMMGIPAEIYHVWNGLVTVQQRYPHERMAGMGRVDGV
jgi:hypothetical protein